MAHVTPLPTKATARGRCAKAGAHVPKVGNISSDVKKEPHNCVPADTPAMRVRVLSRVRSAAYSIIVPRKKIAIRSPPAGPTPLYQLIPTPGPQRPFL